MTEDEIKIKEMQLSELAGKHGLELTKSIGGLHGYHLWICDKGRVMGYVEGMKDAPEATLDDIERQLRLVSAQ